MEVDKMSFGSRLKEKREYLGITQPQLAQMLNVSKGAIGNWETDVNSPRATLLYDLFEILQCDANYLFQDETKELYKDEATPEEFEKLVKPYRGLDDYGKETINIAIKRETDRTKQLQAARESSASSSAAVIEMASRTSSLTRLAEYYHSASAGGGIFILGNESSEKISVPATPENEIVDYVIKVAGDSMEPDYHDGDNVMVSQRVEIRHGDVGIFVVNGKAYIKEYGETELISRNPDSPNIKIAEYDNIVCMGKVVGRLEEPYEIISS